MPICIQRGNHLPELPHLILLQAIPMQNLFNKVSKSSTTKTIFIPLLSDRKCCLYCQCLCFPGQGSKKDFVIYYYTPFCGITTQILHIQREVVKQVEKIWKEAKQNTIIQTLFYTTWTRANPKDH